MAQAIIRSVIDFKRDPWPRVSDTAKDLVRKMLEPDPKKRLSAAEVLGMCLLFTSALPKSIAYGLLFAEHPWIQNAKKAPNVSLGETVKARLKQFSVMNKLKKRALRVVTPFSLVSLVLFILKTETSFHFFSGDSRTFISRGSSWNKGSV